MDNNGIRLSYLAQYKNLSEKDFGELQLKKKPEKWCLAIPGNREFLVPIM